MTKKEIERRITEHAKAIKELIKQRENAKDELELKDYSKPFRQWTVAEQNDLFELSERAYDWFYDGNEQKSILDYNESVPKLERVPLADEVF